MSTPNEQAQAAQQEQGSQAGQESNVQQHPATPEATPGQGTQSQEGSAAGAAGHPASQEATPGQGAQQTGGQAQAGQQQQAAQGGPASPGQEPKTAKQLSESSSLRELRAALRNPDSIAADAEGQQHPATPEATPGQGTQEQQGAAAGAAGHPASPGATPGQEGQQQAQAAAGMPDRIRIGTLEENDQEFILAVTSLARSEKIGVKEAIARVTASQAQAAGAGEAQGQQGGPASPSAMPGQGGTQGQQGQAQAGQQQGGPASPSATPGQGQEALEALEANRARIAAIQEELRAANKSFDTEKATDLQIELAGLVADGRILAEQQAQAARSQEATQAQGWKAQEEQSFAAVESEYPDFQKAGTPLNLAVQQRIVGLEKSNPGFFGSPDWVRFVVRDAAEDLGIVSTRRQAAARAPVQAQGQQGGPASPSAMPGQAGTQGQQQAQAAQGQQQQQQGQQVAPRQPGHPAAIAPAAGSAGASTTAAADEAAALAQSSDPRKLMAFLRANGTRAAAAV